MSGFELEADLNLENWIFDAAISTLDFEYTRVDSSVAVSRDMATPFTPELKYSLCAQYTAELRNSGSVTGRLDINYQDDIYTNSIDYATNRIDAYSIVNGRVAWRSSDESWEMSLEGNNLTDELYYNAIFDRYLSSGSVTVSVVMPRN